MKFQLKKISDSPAQTLCWTEKGLVDLVGGLRCGPEGKAGTTNIRLAYPFDTAIPIPDGQGTVLYERLGTKGILLRENRVQREFNRSYYHADRYDFPICTGRATDGRQILVHCPQEYNRLEIEDLLTGEHLTSRRTESPDFFHSRLQISPNGKWLLSAGWRWHPIDALQVFDLSQVWQRPELLDDKPAFKILDTDMEVQAAAFTPDSHILIATANEDFYDPLDEEDTFFGLRAGQVALFDPKQQRMLWLNDWTTPPGSLVVGGPWALCLHGHPRLYRWKDWTLVHEWPQVFTGRQTSSICKQDDDVPCMAFDLEHGRFAVSADDGVWMVEFWEG